MTEERDMLLLGAFMREKNAEMSSGDAATTLVRNVTRGGLVVYCMRAKIPLPDTEHGREYYTRLRRLTARGNGRLAHLRNRFGDRVPY